MYLLQACACIFLASWYEEQKGLVGYGVSGTNEDKVSFHLWVRKNFCGQWFLKSCGWLYLHASSQKDTCNVVAPINKYEGQAPNKSKVLHNNCMPNLFRWAFTVERVFEGHKNGLSSVFSSLAKIQKFITLLCPNFAKTFLSPVLFGEVCCLSVIMKNHLLKALLNMLF